MNFDEVSSRLISTDWAAWNHPRLAMFVCVLSSCIGAAVGILLWTTGVSASWSTARVVVSTVVSVYIGAALFALVD